MDFKFNSSPNRSLFEIIPTLFNVPQLSDVSFIIDDKTIYAHSFVLKARSEVFEAELTGGEKHQITIDNCKYESFLEFVRYLYTDKCEMSDNTGSDLFRLAVEYKVIKLENTLLKTLISDKWDIDLLNYTIMENYDIAKSLIFLVIPWDMDNYLKSEEFVNLHAEALDKFLEFDTMSKAAKEIQIFDAVAKWIEAYSKANNITLQEGGQQFEYLIDKIRFAAIKQGEIKESVKKFPGLLSEHSCLIIGKHFVFGGDDNNLWQSKVRDVFIPPYIWTTFETDSIFETKLHIKKPVILHGLRVGIEEKRRPIEIEIANLHDDKEKMVLKEACPPAVWNHLMLNLGNSIELKKGDYAIRIKYLNLKDWKMVVRCRMEKIEVVINDESKSVEKAAVSDNMMEIFLKEAAPPKT